MGVSSSHQLQPQELITFKKLPTDVPLDTIEIPERPERRRPTNVKWLVLLGVAVLVLLPFMIYTLYYSNIMRLLGGIDKCGNICGQRNYQWDNIPCSGIDMTFKRYLQYAYEDDYEGPDKIDSLLRERRCVISCKNGYHPVYGTCRPQVISNDTQLNTILENDANNVKYDANNVNIGIYFDSVKWQIIISCLLSILVAVGMLFLFRYAIVYVVWSILIGTFVGLLIAVLAFWYFWMTKAPQLRNFEKYTEKGVLIVAVILTVITAVLGIVLIWSRNKIKLTIMLLKEATKAIFDMPGLIILPVICSVSILILSLLFGITTFAMASAGTLQNLWEDFYYYAASPVMLFSMGYNFVIYLWLVQFFTGIQYLIIAGAVSKWYFARDKNFIESPILTSTSIAFRYHLGNVALGGLIITIVQVIKFIILSLISNDKAKKAVEKVVDAIETFFKFLSKNAYIITAMHGQAFIRSGKRAAKLIFQNINDIIAINFFGDFVLEMAKLVIIVITILLSMGIFAIAPGSVSDSNLYGYCVVIIVSALVATVTFGVFETTVDTLFICYCEDNLLNDGVTRPYFMSRNMMEFVQSSKDVYLLEKEEKEKKNKKNEKTEKTEENA